MGLKDEDILRIARIRVTESAASTFTQVSLDTQLSIERGYIWMIRFVEFHFNGMANLLEVGANSSESISAQVTRESKTSILGANDTDVISTATLQLARSAAIGTDAGPIVMGGFRDRIIKFDPGMAYAAQNIFVAVQGTDAASTTILDVRVGYTLQEVTDKFFFRIAQSLT